MSWSGVRIATEVDVVTFAMAREELKSILILRLSIVLGMEVVPQYAMYVMEPENVLTAMEPEENRAVRIKL